MSRTLLKPSQLPDDISTFVAADTETSGLHPDDGARVAVVSLAWHRGSEIESCAFPFSQGLWVQDREWIERANFGWKEYTEGPEVHGFFKNGKPRHKKIRRKWTVEEKLAHIGPNPNLPEEEWRYLLDWMRAQRGLVWHNALFDLIVMDVGTPEWSGADLLYHTAWDTMLAQRALDPEHLLALKANGERQFGIAPDEQDALKAHLKERGFATGGNNARYDMADWSVMDPYACEDTELTIRLARRQWQRFSDREAPWDLMEHNMDVLASLVRMEQRGLPYQAAESLVWAEKMEARLEEMQAEFPFNPTGPQASEYFFGMERTKRDKPCLGLAPVKLTGSGNPSLDGEVVDVLANREVPWAPEYREYGLTKDAVSRYYRGYAEATGADGRLRTRYRQTGTRAGRFSCERVNLQAIPHDHRLLASNSEILGLAPSPRKLIVAPDGWEIWKLDLAQAELRVAALFAKCERMLEIVREGRDPHGETAIGLGLAAHVGDETKMSWYKSRSVIGKRSNFSLIFGIGPDKFREDLRKQSGEDFGQTMVRRIHKDWNALYPEFKKKIYFDMGLAQKDGWTHIRGPLRRYYTDMERGIGTQYDDLHKAFNQRVQGNLGWFGQHWVKKADRRIMAEGIDERFGGLLMQTHDSLELMLPVGMRWLAEEVADIAREQWAEWFPDVPGEVDIEEWSK